MDIAYRGCWPTMITPFTEDNKLDFKGVKALVDWYINQGCDGIFAVCQSSEMFFLTEQEKIDLAVAVKEAAAGRVKVIASGHTANERTMQIEQLGRMAETGVDAVVLVSNRFAKQEEGEEVFEKNASEIFRQLPEVTFGLYECPYPYLRLLSDKFLSDCAKQGKLVFLKDVSCSNEIENRRIKLVKGTALALFNANTSTLLDSWIAGYHGYNGVMANFHIDLYKWMYNNFKSNTKLARQVSDFLTIAGVCEARNYPVNAKYHFTKTDIPMSLVTRAKSVSLLNENARHEIDSLIRMEKTMRAKLGLKG